MELGLPKCRKQTGERRQSDRLPSARVLDGLMCGGYVAPISIRRSTSKMASPSFVTITSHTLLKSLGAPFCFAHNTTSFAIISLRVRRFRTRCILVQLPLSAAWV